MVYWIAVEYVFTNKVMENVSENEFDPNGKLTLRRIIPVLYNIEKGPGTLEEALDWWKEIGIYDGEEFNEEEAVSRLEMFEILYKYMKYKDISTLEEVLNIIAMEKSYRKQLYQLWSIC